MDDSGSLGGILVLPCWLFLGFLLMFFKTPITQGVTNDQDVYAINNLYTALDSPSVPGWIPNAGDPCADGWQGIQCVGPNITAIILNDADLGGELGENLGIFTSIITIELSNNHITGTIPENLPITLRELILNNNLLNGQLPDSFQSLGFLTNLNLSFNNLSGQLPSSMQSLSSLTTMNIQNNQLSGTLDVLQYLPLNYLNVENNLFSGFLPTQLASIPNFRKDGNLFNTTINPKSTVPSTSLEPAPVSPVNDFNEPSAQGTQSRTSVAKNKKSYRRIIVIIVSVVASGIVLVLLTMVILNFFLSRQQERNSNQEKAPMRGGKMAYERPWMETGISTNSSVENNQVINTEIPETKVSNVTAEKHNDYDIDRSDSVVIMPSPPFNSVIVNPIELLETTTKMPLVKKPIYPTPSRPSTSAIPFSVASLQQYTNSFSEANIILEDKVGKTYRADLPDGKKLMIMKIDIRESILSDDEFRNLALHVSELQHPNILELVGYCGEYGQRLLVYTYFCGRTLHDILHNEDDIRRKLSWNARIQVALRAARALEYLHEGCQLPIIHQKFESSSVLLNDELSVCVFYCGLASISSPSNSVSQISSRIRSLFSYEPPEIRDSGTHSDRSDVYSFGVVMLELLTGREPYDCLRPRAEQYLVRWASTQLHDINTLKRMVDSSIAGKYPVKSLSRFADIISRCIQEGPKFRPPISEVIQDLSRMVQVISKEDG